MTSRNLAIFIAADLALLLLLLLFLSYHGMSHLMLLFMGLTFLLLTLYDLKTGHLSAFFSEFLGLDSAAELDKFRWLPVGLSSLLLVLSVPVLMEHGLVNVDQRWAMQHGSFLRIAIPAALGGLAVIAVATWTVYRGSRDNR